MSFLNKEEIGLVTKSYERVQLQKGFLADTFYRRLFSMAPAARELFPQDMSEQLNKFSSMLDFLVVNLHQPWFFTGKLKKLAKRHVAYGALPEHYPIVGDALIAALHEHLPTGLTEAEEKAWTLLFRHISSMMISAAYPNAA